MSNQAHPPSAERIRLAVPELVARPVLSAGRCAIAAADLICATLEGIRGGAVAHARAILEGLGYEPTEVGS